MSFLPYKPRFINQFYAFVCGYFWLPCPLCGRMYGGHECTESVPTTIHSGKMVCSLCSEEARQITRKFYSQPDVQKAIKEELDNSVGFIQKS